jgi:hypothetical protein
MAARDHRRRAGRVRPWLLAAAGVLALALGVVRGLREPVPPVAEAPAAREPAGPGQAPPASAPPAPAPESEAAEAPPPSRRDAVRALLEQSLAEHFPDRKLSSDELDAAADALMRLRAARLELRALPRTPENAERLRELGEEMGRASEDFEYLVDVDPITFTEKASGELEDEDEDEEPQ